MFSREHTRTKTNKRLRAKQTKGAARSWSFDSVFSMSVFAFVRVRSRLMKPGMTLIELMVSVTILTVMILIASALLTQARAAVTGAEEGIAANSSHRAIAQRLRADIAMLTRTGYMAIVSTAVPSDPNDPSHATLQSNTWAGTHALVFTTVGPFHSRYPGDTHQANAARVDYGIAQASRLGTAITPIPVAEKILFRRAILLTDDPSDPNASGRPRDYEPIPLSYQGAWTRADLATSLVNRYSYPAGGTNYPGLIVPSGAAEGPPPMYVPATRLNHIDALWPYLAGYCDAFTVEWTDAVIPGTGNPLDRNTALPWYGITKTAHPKDNSPVDAWKGRDANFQSIAPANAKYPEFLQNGHYCALWTGADKDHWPKALRIQYRLINSRHMYEVIVDLPQP